MINRMPFNITETGLLGYLPFVKQVTIRQLSKLNYILQLHFPFHSHFNVRITDDHGSWLIYAHRTAVYRHLFLLGLNPSAVVRHD
jgi:hypothetical protein